MCCSGDGECDEANFGRTDHRGLNETADLGLQRDVSRFVQARVSGRS
jgi:hypothetical protein